MRGVQALSEDLKTEDLTHQWPELVVQPAVESGYKPPHLDVLPSAYREFFTPLVSYIRKLSRDYRDRPIAVMIPELVERKWYQFFVRHRTTLLKGLLLMQGGPQIFIITTPWYLRDTSR